VAGSHDWQPGQLLFVGFEGVGIPRELAAWIAAGRVGGVILFARNLQGPPQIRKLITDLRNLAPEETPLTIAIDQEGGRVQRLRDPWTEWPPMRTLGMMGDPEPTGLVARALAIELRDLGIGLDFAPVADVDTNPDNPVIGDRSFARSAEKVCEHVVRFIERMQAEGVAACAKHFPGHGDTSLDSHLALPRIESDLSHLRAVELLPFAAAARASVGCMMTAHVVFAAIDSKRPATLSPDVMALLREDISYDGLVFSDDLEMKAVADHYGPAVMVRDGLASGVDAFLVCRQLGMAAEVLRTLERARDQWLEPGLRRMIAFKHRFAQPAPVESRSEGPPDPESMFAGPPYPEHRALAERIAAS